nr:immunoglobulin light chain junction region [Macaca mulatta]MOW39953.1 immunoglobulin light chain junction region [Macaca mulatta]MOW39961.1 immunoglobulin light chain junction region [Macaca mulatta]MOW39993.1 immunoglobulin light chain junction region [Macaca mulatta]MOW40188.1 immunoglobulin light chain junction region [Macaca mulatta]
CQNYNDSPYTF